MFFTACDWHAIPAYLKTLSNAQFRTAGYMMGEMLMPKLQDSDFWALSSILVKYNSKAFLVTVLKSASNRNINIKGEDFISFCNILKDNIIDVKKTLHVLIPQMTHPNQIFDLFDVLGVNDREQRIPYLMKSSTMPVFYVLFHTLKYVEHDRSILIRTVYFLMKRGDDRSFNFASLLRSYFGLEEVKGTFSLKIEPYQLARLEGSYEAFSQSISR